MTLVITVEKDEELFVDGQLMSFDRYGKVRFHSLVKVIQAKYQITDGMLEGCDRLPIMVLFDDMTEEQKRYHTVSQLWVIFAALSGQSQHFDETIETYFNRALLYFSDDKKLKEEFEAKKYISVYKRMWRALFE